MFPSFCKEQMIVHMPEWLSCIVLQTDNFLTSFSLDLAQAAPSTPAPAPRQSCQSSEKVERCSER